MIIKPISRVRHKPVALVLPGFKAVRIITDEGEKTYRGLTPTYRALKAIENHVVYTPGSLKGFIHTVGAESWTADVWRGHATSMTLDGTNLRVTSLRRTLDDLPTPMEQYLALSQVVLWGRDQGISAGSISSMAWALWRSTLSTPIDMAFDGKVARKAFYGGRQEARSGQAFTDMVTLDIASAYPYEMAARPYAGVMREVSRLTTLDPERAGLAKATIKVPTTLRYAPLPVRIDIDMIQWQFGTIEGVYTWAELDAAKQIGCTVEVARCWAPLTEIEPFTAWWEVVRAGRELVSPGASKLVKAISNSLWGMFGMTGDDRSVVRWADNAGNKAEIVSRDTRKMPQANTVHIAAETTSRVRRRMLLEGLYGHLSNDSVEAAHVDTDGLIVPAQSLDRLTSRPMGDGPGQWRVKNTMSVLEVNGPQLYRYNCGPRCGVDHNGWHYVAAGVGDKAAAELFKRLPYRFTSSAVFGRDIVLPAGPAQSRRNIPQSRWDAQLVQSAVFGESLV